MRRWCSAFSVISHSFIYVYAGLLLWAALDALQKPRWILLLYHLPALLILALIYLFGVSKLQYGGGPPTIHRQGAAYKLDSVYPSDPVSGLTWDLYKQVEK